jgi:hypothetical protein
MSDSFCAIWRSSFAISDWCWRRAPAGPGRLHPSTGAPTVLRGALRLRPALEIHHGSLLGDDVRVFGLEPQLERAQRAARLREKIDGLFGGRGAGGRAVGVCGAGERFAGRLLEGQPPIAIAIDRFVQRLDLPLRILDQLPVGLELGRQLARIPAAELLQLLLVLDELGPGVPQLLLEEQLRVVGHGPAIAGVLVDEHAGQAIRDDHRRARRRGNEADPEGVVADRVDVDVGVHGRHDFFHRTRPAELRIGPKSSITFSRRLRLRTCSLIERRRSSMRIVTVDLT